MPEVLRLTDVSIGYKRFDTWVVQGNTITSRIRNTYSCFEYWYLPLSQVQIFLALDRKCQLNNIHTRLECF